MHWAECGLDRVCPLWSSSGLDQAKVLTRVRVRINVRTTVTVTVTVSRPRPSQGSDWGQAKLLTRIMVRP